LQSSVNDVDYAQEEVLIQETSDNEDLFKGHLNISLVLNYKVFNYQLERLITVFRVNPSGFIVDINVPTRLPMSNSMSNFSCNKMVSHSCCLIKQTN
jgi:hypothetical protein